MFLLLSGISIQLIYPQQQIKKETDDHRIQRLKWWTDDRFFKPVLLLDLGWKWDHRSPEQTMPDKWVTMEGKRVPWELCHAIEGNWGYGRDIPISNRHGWKTNRQLIILLIESVSKGGNLLLNVGPTARGRFNDNTMERLKAIGKWMEQHNRSIYGCTAAPDEFKTPDNRLLTYNPETNRIYIHPRMAYTTATPGRIIRRMK